ncbi:hypothetical protein QN277_028839 [Acacia crassicarpa]|uniref:Uncharacterized protein n=1 Tax=Acacia crassicarpa TaxID=499986 RepID=A0AAE1J5R3_9FABA|nr:hypothetical protein QN277_028839 [Acacia crassicarpa]
MRNSPSTDIEPYDPEIDCTYKQRRRKQKRRSQSVGTASMAEVPNDHEREQQERIAMTEETRTLHQMKMGTKPLWNSGFQI